MVCSQRLVSHYWPTSEFNHRDVFCCVHGIQMYTDHGNIREVLSCMALFFIDDVRQDLSRFSGSFHVFSLGPFWLGRCGCGCSGCFLQAGWRILLDRNGLHGG